MKEAVMNDKPILIAMDMEGVFTPEIWIAVAEKTGLAELRLTTRDIPDYDQLMRGRLDILHRHRLKLQDIQAVIGTLDPLPGAPQLIQWLRERAPLVILTDSFFEFVGPLRAKLGFPTIFCNMLQTDEAGRVTGYRLRQTDGKKHAVAAFQGIGFRVIAAGDSYNDTAMLSRADTGILFRPSDKVVAGFPQFAVTREYDELREKISELLSAPL
jgi:phosphoserine/homoserine phosphotransferase